MPRGRTTEMEYSTFAHHADRRSDEKQEQVNTHAGVIISDRTIFNRHVPPALSGNCGKFAHYTGNGVVFAIKLFYRDLRWTNVTRSLTRQVWKEEAPLFRINYIHSFFYRFGICTYD